MYRPLKTRLASFVMIALFCSASAAYADRRPTVAIVNPDRLQSGMRLVERLADADSYRVVERQNAGAIMPTPVADSPADVIVVLHAAGANSRVVDVVVCESQYGLRLAAARIPAATASVDVVAEMAAVIQQALKKRKEPVQTVIGVVPFRDNSINGRGSSLAAACTHAVEKLVLSRSGAFLIETDRAYAIANELTRGWQRRIVKYPTPCFLLGDCRIDGSESAPQCHSSIELVRGGEILAKHATDVGSREQCVAAAVSMSSDVLGDVEPSTMTASEEDVDILVKQAEEHARTGQWKPAWACAEAALLIAPEKKELRRIAAQSLAGIFKEMRQLPAGEQADGAALRRRWNFLRRAMRQFELYQRDNADFDASKEHRFATSIPSAAFSSPGQPTDDASKQFIQTAQDEVREALLRVVRDRARVGNRDERNLFGFAVFLLPEERKWPMVEQIILDTQHFPDARWRTMTLAKQWFAPNVLDAPLAQKMLDRLEKNGNADVRAAVATLRSEHAAFRRSSPPSVPIPRPSETTAEAVGQPQILFEELKLQVRQKDGGLAPYDSRRCSDIVAAGEGIDIACCYDGIFSVKTKGILTPVWRGEQQLAWFDRVNGSWPVGRPCFDGRYVWACVRYYRDADPVLLMIDPVTDTWRSLAAKDGLPLPSRMGGAIAMTPDSPGRICVASGGPDAWLAMVSFDESNDRLRYNIFHEASDVVDEQNSEQWRSTTLAFSPMYMFMLSSPDDGERQQRRIFIGRYGDVRAWNSPLLVDPDTLDVSVFTSCQIRPGSNSRFGLDGQSMYWCRPTWRTGRESSNPDMYRVGFHEFTQQKVASNFYSGRSQSHAVLFHDGQVHVVSNDWRVAPSIDGPFRKLRGAVPGARGINPQTIFRSNHYGLVLQEEQRNRMYAIRFRADK